MHAGADLCYNNMMNKSSYIVLDFETTGLSPIQNEIIQVGALKYEGKKEIGRYNQLVRPCRSQLSPQISRITGITMEDLQAAPSLNDVFDDFLNFIKGELIVGHNIAFDLNFLNYELRQHERKEYFDSYDTCQHAREKMTFLQNYRLSTIKYFFDMHLRSHDALNDCFITARLYQYLEGIA